MKKILFLIFAISTLLSGCQSKMPSPEEVAITSVYAFNMSVLNNSVSPVEVVSKLNSVSLTGCPQDFISAYKKYSDAWASFEPLAKKMYADNLDKANADLRAFIQNYQQNPSVAALKLKQQWTTLSPEIDTCCAELAKAFSLIKSLGVKYNAAYVPKAWYNM